MSEDKPSDRVRLRRRPQRGFYDRETVYQVIDSTPLGHVGYVIDGQPFVTPTGVWREGDALYWHGSAASRMCKAQAKGIEACVTFTHMDGYVLARSARKHSMLYRSAMVFGVTEEVTDPAAKKASLDAFIDFLSPGRAEQVRAPTENELKEIKVIRMPIDEAAAKIKEGGVVDFPEDMAHPVWAGVIPVTTQKGEPIEDQPAE